MKRTLTILLSAVLLIVFLVFPVSANTPEPSPYCIFYLTNLPSGTTYVDLLIKLSESDQRYVESQDCIFPSNAEIMKYSENGYRSYSFHFQDASSSMKPSKYNGSTPFESGSQWYSIHFGHSDEIFQQKAVRLAMLDADGNILSVTEPLRLSSKSLFSHRLAEFYYDAATGSFEVAASFSPGALIGYLLFTLIGIVFTCLIEWVTGFFFKLTQPYGKLILWTNVVSQIIMRICYTAIYALISWKYILATVILEVLIYAGEFLFYHRIMKSVTTSRQAAYTFTANTASLVLGLIVMSFFS